MELRQTIQSDIDFIKSNPLDDRVKTYPELTPMGDCVTGVHNGVIWGVGGVVVHWEGMGEFWLMLTKGFNKDLSGSTILREIMSFVEDKIEEHNLHRAQAVIRFDYVEAIKMIEFLGFEREGVLRNYLPGPKDAYMYSRIRDVA